MSDLISKALLSGLGLANMTREAIQQTAEDLVNRSQLSEEEGRRLVKDFQKRSVEAQKALEKRVDEAVHKALKKLNLAAPAGRGTSQKKVAGKGKRRGGRASAAR